MDSPVKEIIGFTIFNDMVRKRKTQPKSFQYCRNCHGHMGKHRVWCSNPVNGRAALETPEKKT